MAKVYTLQIPRGRYHFRRPYTLENVRYWFVFRFGRWDTSPDGDPGAWHLEVEDAAGDPVVRGVRLSLGKDKFARFKYRGAPPGKLNVVDLSGLGIEPKHDDLGTRVVLEYEEAGT